MALTAGNVVVGQSGSIMWGTTGITAPGSITGSTSGYNDFGYLDEDGLTFSVAPSVTDLNVWQSVQPIRKIVSSQDISLSGRAAEINAAVIPALFGGGTLTGSPAAGTYAFVDPGGTASQNEVAVVADVVDGTDRLRFVFGRASQAEASEVQFNRSNIAALSFSFSILAPAAGGSPGTLYTAVS